MSGSSEDDLVTLQGCFMTAKWEWASDIRSGRWSRPQQIIKPMRVASPQASNQLNSDFQDVKYTKVKVRGQGKALVLRFESEDGKDFSLFGWSIPFTGENKP